MNRGHLSAIIAYLLWGLFPFYWQWLKHVAPVELICHRILWSFVALTIAMVLLRQPPTYALRQVTEQPSKLGWSLLSAILIAINWLVFIIAVQQNQVLESSLGYFITPLMSVALGVFCLRERLGPWQWLAVAIAALGVTYIAIRLGYLPIYALTLATSFGIYGIVKKQAPLSAAAGLWLETAILVIPAGAYLAYEVANGRGSFGTLDRLTDALIIAAGPITTIPLLLFAFGARRIPLFQLGILQYIAPSIQFVVGWLALREPVSFDRWVGFSLVWLALIVFTYAQTQSPGRTRTQ